MSHRRDIDAETQRRRKFHAKTRRRKEGKKFRIVFYLLGGFAPWREIIYC
jgi:hypothetical protein